MDLNNTDNSTYTMPGHSTACPVPQACGSRLPCGVCLITNQKCPLMPCAPSITWTNSDGLYNPQFGPTCTTQSTEQNARITVTMNSEKEQNNG